jgi:uncharacterized membrane protein YkoI
VRIPPNLDEATRGGHECSSGTLATGDEANAGNSEEKGDAMDARKLIVGALAATALTVGGGAAIAAQQAPETTGDETRQEEQEPSYKGSIQAPADKEGQTEAAEAQQLQSLARIDQTAAEQAALQEVPGTIKEAELGNENGYVVWEVEVAANDGTLYEVKVDAGNGQVLHHEPEDEEGSEQGEANEASEGAEGSEANEPAETTGN